MDIERWLLNIQLQNVNNALHRMPPTPEPNSEQRMKTEYMKKLQLTEEEDEEANEKTMRKAKKEQVQVVFGGGWVFDLPFTASLRYRYGLLLLLDSQTVRFKWPASKWKHCPILFNVAKDCLWILTSRVIYYFDI